MTEHQYKRSQRANEHEEILAAALARPGVREVMQVYEHWRDSGKALDIHKAVARSAEVTATSSSSVSRLS